MQAEGLHKASGLDLSQPQGAQVEDLVWPGGAEQIVYGPRRGPLATDMSDLI